VCVLESRSSTLHLSHGVKQGRQGRASVSGDAGVGHDAPRGSQHEISDFGGGFLQELSQGRLTVRRHRHHWHLLLLHTLLETVLRVQRKRMGVLLMLLLRLKRLVLLLLLVLL